MQEFIKSIFVSAIIILLLFFVLGLIKEANSADYSGEKALYVENKAGGVIAVTKELCKDPKSIEKGFKYMAFATDNVGGIFYGCWMSPDTTEAQDVPGMRVIAVVNLYFGSEIVTIPQQEFKLFSQLEGAI
jgi:hypothetical protein